MPNNENLNSEAVNIEAARPEQTVLLGLDYGVKKMGMALAIPLLKTHAPSIS